jgi:hypothetical protein
MICGEGRNLPLQQQPEYNPRASHVEFMMDEVTLGVVCLYFSFLCQLSFHQLHQIRLSSDAVVLTLVASLNNQLKKDGEPEAIYNHSIPAVGHGIAQLVF